MSLDVSEVDAEISPPDILIKLAHDVALSTIENVGITLTSKVCLSGIPRKIELEL